MNILSDALMKIIDNLQPLSLAFAGDAVVALNFEAYGCRNACSGSCKGDCFGSCERSCSGGVREGFEDE